MSFLSTDLFVEKTFTFELSDTEPLFEDEDEMLRTAIAISLEENSRESLEESEDEMLARALALSLMQE